MDDMQLQFEIYVSQKGFDLSKNGSDYINKSTIIAFEIWRMAWNTSIEFIE